MFNPPISLTYEDLGLKPIYYSDIESRDLVDTSIDFLGYQLQFPIISAPMATISCSKLANTLTQLGGISCLARTNNFQYDLDNYMKCNQAIPSVPAKDSKYYIDSYLNVNLANHSHIICIDVANGFNKLLEKPVRYIKDNYKFVEIITGNVASLEGYKYLSDLGVHAVRVGISGGSVCATALQTRVGVGQATLIRELAEYKYKSSSILPEIIADGGIKYSGDIAMALALGADIVMSGSLFAGTEESAGDVINDGGALKKHYAGQASKYIKGNAQYVEGADLLVSYKGPVVKVWNNLVNGLKSSMAYMNCKTIKDFKYLEDSCFVWLQNGAKIERGITAK